MGVDPSGADIQRFRDEDDGRPVVMLNLLRFAGEAGRASYAQYAERVQPFLAGIGATTLYAGDCSTTLVGSDASGWDAVAIVRYPSRSAFLEMVMNPDYQAITHLRTQALEATVLQATVAWGG